MTTLLELAAYGGHWCGRCESYVAKADSDAGRPAACERCGNPGLRFDPPVEGFSTSPEFTNTQNDLVRNDLCREFNEDWSDHFCPQCPAFKKAMKVPTEKETQAQ